MFRKGRLHRSQYLFWLCIGICLGAAQVPGYSVLGLAIFAAIAYRLKAKRTPNVFALILLVGVIVGGQALGDWRYSSYRASSAAIPFEETTTISGWVSQAPRQQTKQGMAQQIVQLEIGQGNTAYGVRVKADPYPIYQYGQQLQVTCKLKQPEPFDGFAYDKYLVRYGVYATCSFPKISVVQDRAPEVTPIMYKLHELRRWLQARIELLWREPVASLYLGVIVGIQDTIPEALQEAFRKSGTIHVLVVSGMHVAIIVQLMSSVLEPLLSPRWRVVVIGIGVFALAVVTGLQASVIRAGLMGMVPLIAKMFGRPVVQHIGLAAVATGMIVINPYILLHDMGFQLSFLATIGLMYVEPLARKFVDAVLDWIPERLTIQETLSTTMAATATTTPLILYQFGTFSVIGMLANMVVVPITNLMLFAGSGIVLVSLISVTVAEWLAIPLHWPVQAMVWLMEVMAQWSWIQLDGVKISLGSMIACYAVLILVMLQAKRSK